MNYDDEQQTKIKHNKKTKQQENTKTQQANTSIHENNMMST
jgi:hypothetical protein